MANKVTQNEIQDALSQIQYISQTIEGKDMSPDRRKFLRVETAILFLLLAADLLFVGIEKLSANSITDQFATSKGNFEVQMEGVAVMLFGLVLIGGGVYFMAWRRAHEIQGSVKRVLKRDLGFLELTQIVPDITLKFLILSGVIFINRPDLVSALLTAFLADYVWQGRFFRLPAGLRATVGAALYAIAGYMFAKQVFDITPALICFAVVCITSIIYIMANLRGPENK